MVHSVNRRDLLLGATALAACAPAASVAPAAAPAPFPMRRGVNLGNALEAPNEGDWGYRIEAAHLAAIADAGFDGVRLPVRWDAHAGSTASFAITSDFFRRVDEVTDWALRAGLKVQLDLHHYSAFVSDPAAHRTRFLSLWDQIARRYRETPLIYEPFNEPNGPRWPNGALEALQREVVGVIRAHAADALIVLGPGNWQNIDALRDWRPPAGQSIAVSVHYYEPHAFTHQNAEWLGADAPTFGRNWGTVDDREQVRAHIEQAAHWGASRSCAMQLGEFGVNRALPLAQRALWTRTVREACEANGVGWCVWDFAGAFPIWDRDAGAFIPQMRDALLS